MNSDIQIRFIIFIAILLFLITAEFFFARRSRILRRKERWITNISLISLDWLIARFTIGFAPLYISYLAFQKKWGLIGWLEVNNISSILITIIILDLAIYFQHIIFHFTPTLWRLHKVHHTDLDLDVTSGLRFHPIEILLSLVIKIGIITAIGANPLGVLIFESLLNSCSLFNHSNINIKGKLDYILRLFIVTPDMHRIHHSTIARETNSNFGFTITIWDRLFGTYREKATKEQRDIALGLREYQDPKKLKLLYLLVIPFVRSHKNGVNKRNH